ncbi:MAG: amino acid adenylation domain-containing protein [Bacteroidia bacterium]|nr:amino acid adenylation domain-containing protein [Bacteroidia bacterium]MCZ2277188.1 amino acid adenylation domain-containing protein [Bacteroidia bacterium]
MPIQLTQQQKELLDKYNRTQAVFPSLPLAALLEEQTRITPSKEAIRYKNTSLSYSELNSRANQFAHFLRKEGAGRNQYIGLCISRSAELAVTIAGIIKSGAAYVPFDPTYPHERIRYMIRQSGIRIVIAEKQFVHLFSGSQITVLTLEELTPPRLINESKDNPEQINFPEDAAYVLFTSGSTGSPKGVVMIHRALSNLIYWQKTKTNLSSAAVTLQFAPISFDVSFQELFSTWATGGSLVMIDDDFRLNAIKLLEFIQSEKIERLFLPFIALQHLSRVAVDINTYPDTLKDVITAGEQLRITSSIRKFFSELKTVQLHNHYGPTETHVITAYTLPSDRNTWPELPPIGTPVSNTKIFLLDENLQPVKEGEEGELYAEGAALAQGYINAEALTNERFITNPFDRDSRLYKTGDLARYTHDGTIEYLGRADGQVKVRGYRIELAEVESAIEKHTDVKQAVATVREDEPGNKKLTAYVVMNQPVSFSTGKIRDHLKTLLPDYMMPSAIIQVKDFPRTPSGKIDKRSLPKPENKRPDLSNPYIEPVTELEKILASLWCSLLEIDKAGTEDNFFDLGGNSLLALQMIARLKTEYGYDLQVVRLYQHPTIRGIENVLSGADTGYSFYEKAQQRADLKQTSTAKINSVEDGVAIIGMAGRFPGAATIKELWEIISQGKETTKFFTREELDPSIPEETKNDSSYVAARGVIEDADKFDASFFGINPKVAELMDPQQRVMLETAWAALEHAGYCADQYQGLIGVFAGMGNNTYYPNNVHPNHEKIERVGSFLVMTGNEKDYIATRIAHEMNLTGPALSIHTACSTSLVSVAVAFENLLNNKCDMALAGGVSITVPVNSGHIYNEGGMFSSDGHTRPFDAKATGTVFSDGCGMVVLKRYRDAVKDGDRIYAVIRGAALNNDGSGKASFTAPSVDGQAMVISLAQAQAGVDPGTITYVETHGTATPLGDPIEVEALTLAFRGKTDKKQFCALGSVKSNFGHLTPAAGVTGLIKTVLSMQHRQIPATLHFEKANPAIDFENSPFYVNNKLIEWNTNGTPRRAGISSFGVGGTNVHIVVEEAPEQQPSGIARSKHLLLISAKSTSALDKTDSDLSNYLANHPELKMADAAYTLQCGRKFFNHRRFKVTGDLPDKPSPKNSASGVTGPVIPGVVFMFPGQGAQYVNMGQNLYRDEIVFRQAVTQCAEHFTTYLKRDIRDVLYPSKGKENESSELLKETSFTQPALFTIGYALAKLWEHWGITPKALIGHSIGEYAAACIAGIMSLEDACMVVAARGMMMQNLPAGSMLSVRLASDDVKPYLNPKLSIAAINGPQLCVVSGETAEVEKLQKRLEEKEIICKLLVTSHAFHSSMMDPMLKPFEDKIKTIRLHAPQIPMVSTVTADWLKKEEAMSPAYWSNQIRSAVRFAEGVQTLWKVNQDYFLLELGPRATASTLARQQATDQKRQVAYPCLSDTAENDAEWSSILFATGQLWLKGISINRDQFYALENRKRVPLPTYPFERKRYWVDPPGATQSPGIQSPTPVLQPFIQQPPVEQNVAKITMKNNRKEKIINELKNMFEEASGIEMQHAPSDVSFVELGLDSLFLTQTALSITKQYGVKVTFRQLNDDLSTLDTLSGFLDSKLPEDSVTPEVQPQSPPTRPVPFVQQPMTSSNDMNTIMMQQMQLMQQMMMQQIMIQQGVQPVVQQPAPAVQAHIEKSVEIKAQTKKEDLTENEKADLAKPFGAIARIEKTSSGDLTDAQKKWLHEFTQNYNKKTAKSKAWCQYHRKHLADPRVVTGFKPQLKELIYQIVVNKSKGVNMWDLDGNQYTDVLNGFGSNFFGWGSDLLMKTWKKQLEEGIELGPQTELAGECAELICSLTGYDRAGFCNTGSEAVLGAMRIARTVTGRNLIVCFNGSYHGINDEIIVRGSKSLKSFPAAAGIPKESVQNMLVLDYGTKESLDIIRERIDEIAAVMIEPIQSRRADFHPKEFIHDVRKITKENGVLMIFDEVITGFRLRLGGAQEYYEVDADISTYGKVIGGNMPIGAIAGRKEYMDALDGGYWQFGDDSVPEVGVTYFAGTFVRHPLAMAAMKEVLLFLKQQGKPLFEMLNGKTQRLVDEVNAHCKQLNIAYKLVTFGSLFKSKWDIEPAYTELLFARMRYKGVHIMDGFPCFLTLAFTDADVDFVIKTFKESLSELTELGFIPLHNSTASSNGFNSNGHPTANKPPVPGAKLGKDQNGKPGWFVPDPERPGKYLQIK